MINELIIVSDSRRIIWRNGAGRDVWQGHIIFSPSPAA